MEIIGKKERLIGCNVITTNDYNASVEICNENFFKNFPNYKIIFNNIFIQKFKEEKIAVNCETQEEAEEFCNILDKNNLRWEYYYSDNTRFSDYGKKTCYTYHNNSIWYASFDYYEKNDYTIIKFKDILFKNTMNIKEESKEILMKKEQEYEFTGRYTLKDLLDKKPCSEELYKFIQELNKKFSFRTIMCFPENIYLCKYMFEYESFKNNIQWCVDAGLVKEIKTTPELKVGQKWRSIKNETGYWRVIQINGKLEFLSLDDYIVYGDTNGYKEWIYNYELVEDSDY